MEHSIKITKGGIEGRIPDESSPGWRDVCEEMLKALKEAKETIEYVKQYVTNSGLSAEDDCNEAIKTINLAIKHAGNG